MKDPVPAISSTLEAWFQKCRTVLRRTCNRPISKLAPSHEAVVFHLLTELYIGDLFFLRFPFALKFCSSLRSTVNALFSNQTTTNSAFVPGQHNMKTIKELTLFKMLRPEYLLLAK